MLYKGVTLDAYLARVEIREIKQALLDSKGNKTKAAKALGISFRSLRYRINKHGINKIGVCRLIPTNIPAKDLHKYTLEEIESVEVTRAGISVGLAIQPRTIYQ